MNDVQYRITIVGLGPGPLRYLTLETLEALQQAPSVVLRTRKHPAADELPEQQVRFTTCDDLYERHSTFEEVYQAIAARVVETAERASAVVYAVPGDPMVAERTVQILQEIGRERADLVINVLPAIGVVNLAIQRLRIDPGEGLLIADARDPHLRPATEPPALEDHAAYHGALPLINPTLPTLWLQLDTPLVTGNLKVLLLDHYPPEHPVTVLTALGGGAQEQIITLPLSELDRGPAITHLTSLYLPPLSWQQRRHTLTDLLAIMALLRSDRGCPWDREQDMPALRRTVIEEAYEVAEAIDRGEPDVLADELGDLLMNVIFLAQLGAEEGLFDFSDVVQALADKLIRRHVHVFGDVEAETSAAVLRNWEQIKAGERAEKGTPSIFADVPLALPALARSQKIQKRAARVGFDWVDFRGPLLKLYEELQELAEEFGLQGACAPPTELGDPLVPQPEAQQLVESAPRARLLHEIGDIFFAGVNLCRFVHLDAEEVMREANDRFVRRFHRVEAAVQARGQRVEELPLAALDQIWVEVKGDD
ncbi:MAG TPA: nucleoside triphosphate pyrophosphohydrolase [Armatimonadota bacterium]|jgi:tetrapyrrole methylase family protein/MazG family protein